MKITFYGHAALGLEVAGTRLITDPYSPGIGLAPLQARADIVTLSHENPKWHSHLDSVGGDFSAFWGLQHLGQSWELDPFTLEAILVWENLPADGPNAMVKITGDNLRVLHMGDCGHLPEPEAIEACGEVDILLALAGGTPTLGIDDLMAFIEEINPKVVIPMHYAVPHLAMNALPVQTLVDRFEANQVIRHNSSVWEIKRADLPAQTQLHILKPLRAMA